MYYASVEKSHEIALVKGSYDSIKDSPISKGILQPHMWGNTTEMLNELTPKLNWNILIDKVKMNNGCIRNSLLIALAPTQSTSHILGSTECFEPLTQIMYAKETLSGNFQIFNKYFQQDMILLEKWNSSNLSNLSNSSNSSNSSNLREKIILDNGSIANLFDEVPLYIRNIYKTIWEIKPTDLIQMDADRGKFVCQSQSSNRYIEKPTTSKIYTIVVKAWKLGLKTAIYYLRSKPAVSGIKFSIDKPSTNDKREIKEEIKQEINEESKESKFRKWLEISKKKAESGDCTACQ
jgi:ribonucleoside-diphosphate reductase alpha chain